jgi:hypothetical protein
LAVIAVEAEMNTRENDPPTGLYKAAEAVRGTTEVVQATSQSIAGAIEAGRRPSGLLDQLAKLTREMPLRSLGIAFLFGFMFSRRR